MMSRLFDVYIAVDWSARAKPSSRELSKDAIWIGEKVAEEVSDDAVIDEVYKRTRTACISYVQDRLRHHIQYNRRVFVGFDFGYGYPEGFAQIFLFIIF
jgi:hypothetical protein